MKYSVIIAERNEPDLKNTVDNIKANSAAHVVVMSDTKGYGPQSMRDKGIGLSTSSDVVIVMDGHMRVKAGTLDAMAEHCAQNPQTVATTYCHHSYKQDWTSKPYAGASIEWTSQGKDANEPQAFTAKWRTERTTGQIPCIMGACYGFTRDWYMDGLRRPWQFGTGWGCDEELLSAATWLRGGSVELLDLAVWHQARKPGLVPYRLTDAQLYGVWANRVRILDMMPMNEADRAELVRHLMPALSIGEWQKVQRINARSAEKVSNYRDFLSSGPLSWADFKRKAVGVQSVSKPTMKELRKAAKAMGITVPFGCKKDHLVMLLDNKRKTDKPAAKPAAPKKQAVANWGAGEMNNLGKRACVHCGGGITVVTRVMRAGKLVQRYRRCNECHKNFPTREIITMP